MLRILPFALLLSACSGAEPDPPAEPSPAAPQGSPSASPSVALVPIATLEGEWRVAGIDGAEFDEPYGLALSGSESEIWWEPRCAGSVRRYTLDGLSFTAIPPPNAAAEPACDVAFPPRQADVTRALDTADTIGRTASNGIEISGGGHSLLLFSQ